MLFVRITLFLHMYFLYVILANLMLFVCKMHIFMPLTFANAFCFMLYHGLFTVFVYVFMCVFMCLFSANALSLFIDT